MKSASFSCGYNNICTPIYVVANPAIIPRPPNALLRQVAFLARVEGTNDLDRARCESELGRRRASANIGCGTRGSRTAWRKGGCGVALLRNAGMAGSRRSSLYQRGGAH